MRRTPVADTDPLAALLWEEMRHIKGATDTVVASLAARWQCGESTVRKLIGDERLGCFRVGTGIRIAPDEVERFERQSTRSSGSRDDTQSSGETTTESVTATALPRLTDLERKVKQGLFGRRDTVRTGPWAGS